jgi:hypothetical protein
VHRRSVQLDSPNRILTVVDTFDTRGELALSLTWHIGPGVVVEMDGTAATLTWQVGRQGRRAMLALPADLSWTAHTAETDPVLGWYSPRFGRRVPATSLVGQGAGSATTRLETVLTLP